MDLKGTVAVVTGGNGGLGQRICHALAAQGCHIAVVYAQSKDQADGVARDLEKHQVGAAAFACDVTKRDQVQRMVDDVVKRFGRLDILVNDAAYNKSIPFKDLDNLTYEEWTKIIDINLTGPMLVHQGRCACDEAAGQRAHRQHLVGGRAGADRVMDRLCRFQGGLIHLTRCMAVALAPEVLVNCVARGLLEGTRATANLQAGGGRDRAQGVTAGQGRRQGRLRRSGGHDVPHQHHDRPDAGDGNRAVSSIEKRLLIIRTAGVSPAVRI